MFTFRSRGLMKVAQLGRLVAIPAAIGISFQVGVGATEAELVVNPHQTLFPSLVLCTTEARVGDRSNPATELGRHLTSAPAVGDPRHLVGLRLRHYPLGKPAVVSISCPGLIEPTRETLQLPSAGDMVELYPKIGWNFDALGATIVSAPKVFKATVTIGSETRDASETIDVRSINDCLLDVDGYKTTWSLVAYVDEDHQIVQTVLKEALQTGIVPNFVGYDVRPGNADGVDRQIAAVWCALQHRGIRYSSIITESAMAERMFSQHVRLLTESLDQQQANCVDGTTLLASVLQKIGLHTRLVAVPGHMFLEVDLSREPSSDDGYRFIETTRLGAIYERMPPKEITAEASLGSYIEACSYAHQEAAELTADRVRGILDVGNLRGVGLRPVHVTAGIYNAEVQRQREAAAKRFDEGVRAYRAGKWLDQRDYDRADQELAHLQGDAEVARREDELAALRLEVHHRRVEENRVALEKDLAASLAAAQAAIAGEDAAVAVTSLGRLQKAAHDLDQDAQYESLAKVWEARQRELATKAFREAVTAYWKSDVEKQGKFEEARVQLTGLLSMAELGDGTCRQQAEQLLDGLPQRQQQRDTHLSELKRRLRIIVDGGDYAQFKEAGALLAELQASAVTGADVDGWSKRLTSATPWLRKSDTDRYGTWGEIDAGTGGTFRFRRLDLGTASTPNVVWMSECELTVADVLALSPRYHEPGGNDIGTPASGITADIADDVLKSLHERTGQTVRLPTLQEWTTACTAGTTGVIFYQDEKRANDYVWSLDNAGGHPHTVGTLRPNPNGLFDMLGNVAELATDGKRLVVTGGSFKSLAFDLDRVDDASDLTAPSTGLRVIVVP